MVIIKRIKVCCSLAGTLFRVFFQLLYGAWRISKLSDPMVSIFGGTHLKDTDFYFKKAHSLGEQLVAHDISVVTGGGPGLMQAVSCAVYESHGKSKSIGIGVRDLKEQRNPCVQEYFELDQFFARKWLLTRYSMAFIVFPGGFGTVDELAEVLTLIQTK